MSSGQNLLANRNKWFVDELYGHICYGVETDGDLRDCFGIFICLVGIVCIGYYDEDGTSTNPRIYFNAYGIK